MWAGSQRLAALRFAVLLALFLGQLRPVRGRVLLGLDELRHQRQHAAVTVGHHRRREHRMEVLLALVGPDMADRALRTADRVRAVDLDAVQGHQQATAETLERGQGTLLADGVEAEREEVGKAVGVQPVQQVTNAVVTWDGLHTEERVAIGAGALLLHAALEFQEGRGLEKEGRQGAGSGVAEVVAGVSAAPGIRQGGSGSSEGIQQAVQNMFHSSCIDRTESLCQLRLPQKQSPINRENLKMGTEIPK